MEYFCPREYLDNMVLLLHWAVCGAFTLYHSLSKKVHKALFRDIDVMQEEPSIAPQVRKPPRATPFPSSRIASNALVAEQWESVEKACAFERGRGLVTMARFSCVLQE